MKGKLRLRAKEETFETLLRLRDSLGPVEAYLTGGFVRDTLLGRATADVDIVVAAPAMKLAPEVAHTLGGKYVALDEMNEIARVVLRGEEPLHLDFSTMRGSIEEDLSQRDFTIDAIAVDLNDIEKPSFPFIDPYNKTWREGWCVPSVRKVSSMIQRVSSVGRAWLLNLAFLSMAIQRH